MSEIFHQISGVCIIQTLLQ